MGVKGDFKAVNPASSVNVTAAKKDISVETAPKRDYKDDVRIPAFYTSSLTGFATL
jgi:hypothetical protein